MQNRITKLDIHPLINCDEAFTRTPFCDLKISGKRKSEKVWLKKLMTLCEIHQTGINVRNAFNDHVGPNSTFTEKATLIKYLCLISAAHADSIENLTFSADEKVVFIKLLADGLSKCTRGFLERAKKIILAFKLPQNMDELLAHYRIQLVERAAYGIDEVHTQRAHYVVANTLGLGIPCDGISSDPLDLTIEEIQEKLSRQFEQDYVPAKLISEILQASMLQIGYSGYKAGDEFYRQNIYDKIITFLRKILNNSSLQMSACFIIDESNDDFIVRGIHWPKVDSLLIEYLENNHYLFNHTALNDSYTEGYYHIDGHELIINFYKDDLENARLAYTYLNETGEKITVNSFLFTEHQDRTPDLYPMRSKLIANFVAELLSSIDELSINQLASLTNIATPSQMKVIEEKLAEKIASMDDLIVALNSIRSADICVSLCRLIKHRINIFFNDSDNLFSFFSNLNYHPAFTKICGEIRSVEIFKSIQTGKTLSELFKKAGHNTYHIICDSLYKKFPTIINTIDELISILYHLAAKEQQTVINAIKPRLKYLFTSMSDVSRFFDACLGDEEDILDIDDEYRKELLKYVLTWLVEKKPDLLTSAYHVAKFINVFKNTVDNIYDIVLKILPRIVVDNFSNFILILSSLTKNEWRIDFYHRMKNKIKGTLRLNEMAYFLSLYPTSIRANLANDLKILFNPTLKHPYDFLDLFRNVNDFNLPAVQSVIISTLYQSFFEAHKTTDKFILSLKYLVPDWRYKFLTELVAAIPNVNTSVSLQKFYRLYADQYKMTWQPVFFGNIDRASKIRNTVEPHLQWNAIIKETSEFPDDLFSACFAQICINMYQDSCQLKRHAEIADSTPAKRARAR